MVRSRTIRRNILRGAGLLGAGLAAVPALAQDEGGLRMVFGIEQRLDAGRNIGLEVPDEGDSISATTRLSFGLSDRTGLSALELNASTALVVENTPDTDGTEISVGRPDLAFAFTREVPNALVGVTAHYREDDVDAFDDDLTEDADEGTRTDYGAGIRLETGRTDPLGFAAGLSHDVTEYQDVTDPDLNDIRTTRLDLETSLRFSEVLTGRVGLAASRAEEEDAASTLTESLTASAGFDYTVSERMTLGLSLGHTRIDTEEFGVTRRETGPFARLDLTYAMANGSATAALAVATDADEGTRTTFEIGRSLELPMGAFSARLGVTNADEAGTDVIGGLLWSRALPDSRIEIGLERSVSYDDDDDETVVDTAFSVAWSQDVNALSSIGLDLSYEISDAPSERVEETGIGATWRYSLTPDWRLDTGVRYRVRDDLDGRAESPSAFVAVSRSFDFRP